MQIGAPYLLGNHLNRLGVKFEILRRDISNKGLNLIGDEEEALLVEISRLFRRISMPICLLAF